MSHSVSTSHPRTPLAAFLRGSAALLAAVATLAARAEERVRLDLSIEVDGAPVLLADDPLDDWPLDADGVVERRGSRLLDNGLWIEWNVRLEERRGIERPLADPEMAAALAGPWIIKVNTITKINTGPNTIQIGPASAGYLGCLQGPLLGGGSVIGAFMDIGGAGSFIQCVGPKPMYTAMIDGAPAATLLDAPFAVAVPPWTPATIGPASFGSPIPSMPMPPVTTQAVISYLYELGPGGAATFFGVFVLD